MHLASVGLKDYLIIGSLTGFLRMTSMQLAGYNQSDFTFWGSYGTWTLSSIIAILVYTITTWLLELREKIGTEQVLGEEAGRDDGNAEGWTTPQK